MTTQAGKGVALVTGASSGIGEVYARRLAVRGYDLILVARGRDRLATLSADISAATGRSVEALAADLGTADGRSAVEARLLSDPDITLLVNNAGIASGGPLASADPDALEGMVDLNIIALTRLSATAAKVFVARRAGTIINLSSILSLLSTPSTAAYGATKAYVLHFSRGLDEEVAGSGVRVQAVLPGYTRTPMLSEALLSTLPPDMVMPVDQLVDAALAGLDRGELVTIPSLPDLADWEAFEAARTRIAQSGSRDRPADRYAISA